MQRPQFVKDSGGNSRISEMVIGPQRPYFVYNLREVADPQAMSDFDALAQTLRTPQNGCFLEV